MERPPALEEHELRAKLIHLRNTLEKYGKKGVLLTSEGAMRWLTGIRHQVLDIHPAEATTVAAMVIPEDQRFRIILISEPWEFPRVRALIENRLISIQGLSYEMSSSFPDQIESVLLPHEACYGEIIREVISVLPEREEGNQMRKIAYLLSASRASLLETAEKVEAGMSGWELRSLVYEIFHHNRIELNQVLLGLDGMVMFNHPMVDDKSRVIRGGIIKIVVGARYADMIHSATQLVKIGSEVNEKERKIYYALAEFAMAYANEFHSGERECDLYASLEPLAQQIERKYGIAGFAGAAHTHHAGGPISPLGNRDFVLSAGGTRRILPYTQFSINPVDSMMFHKVELQGLVIPDSPPLIFDEFTHAGLDLDAVSLSVQSEKGEVRLPTIISTEG